MSETIKSPDSIIELSLKDLCSIISACRKHDVRSLSYKGLELTLLDLSDTPKSSAKKHAQTSASSNRVSARETYSDEELFNHLEDLKINDPVEYERRISEEFNAKG